MPAKSSGITSLAKLRRHCAIANASDPDCCWLWMGAAKPSGRAAIRIHDPAAGKGKVVSAPRAAAVLSGDAGPAPQRTWTSCCNVLCCNPRHARGGTYAEWGAWVEASGLWKGNPRNQAAAVARARRRSSLNPEVVEAIRTTPLPAAELAPVLTQMVGKPVTVHMIHRARSKPTCWAPVNPFAGLGAR